MKDCIKRIIFNAWLLLTICCAMFVPTQVEASNVNYIRATKEDIYIYKSPTQLYSERLFVFELSYYARVVDEVDAFYMVEIFDNLEGFNKIIGYVKRVDATIIDSQPTLPLYPKQQIFTNRESANIYSIASNQSSMVCIALAGQPIKYYGKLDSNGATYYCVNFAGNLGYVLSSQIASFEIPLHPTPLPSDKPIEPTPPIKPPKQPFEPLQILLVLLVCAPAVIIVVLIFIPSRTNHKIAATKKSNEINNSQQKYSRAQPRYIENNDDDTSDYDLL